MDDDAAEVDVGPLVSDFAAADVDSEVVVSEVAATAPSGGRKAMNFSTSCVCNWS